MPLKGQTITSTGRLIPVFLETPYHGPTQAAIDKHISYAKLCMIHCFELGEAPFASHLLYAATRVLHDERPVQRALGIEAGFTWRHFAVKTVVYQDLGISKGMHEGINHSRDHGIPVEYRNYPNFKELIGEV